MIWNIPSSDAGKLARFFSEENKGTLPISQKKFIQLIGRRIYTEWYRENAELLTDGHKCSIIRAHEDERFPKFIRDETHYELERRGYVWDEARKRFNTVDNWTYNAVRDQVLRGLTGAAIDLFKDYDNDYSKPKPEDTRNLRQDLSAFTRAGYLKS